jgi:FlaG/FlaF family flagellin (archaellin)
MFRRLNGGKKMKGVSTIIASILMVVITIGLTSVAYLYMSGLLISRTVTNIQLADAYCKTGSLYFLIKNIGTQNINNNVTVVIRGSTLAVGAITCDPLFPLGAGNSTFCRNTSALNTQPGANELRIIGPSNAVGGTVFC